MKINILNFILLLSILITGCKQDDNTTEPDSTHGEWKIVRNADTTNHFYGLCFADKMNGWAVGNFGLILRTTDGGNSWNAQESGTTSSFRCVYFVSLLKGWISGTNNSIGMTTNGGSTWSWQHPDGDSTRIFFSIFFIDENTGWITGEYGGILHTKDGGKIWLPQASGTTWPIMAIQFLDDQEGWATSLHTEILHTTNGGNNWTIKSLDSLNNDSDKRAFEDIFFVSNSKGWIATNPISNIANPTAPILHTSNAGISWSPQPIQTHRTNTLQFVNENSGWAAGTSGIIYTSDGGVTWINQLVVSSGMFVDICFVDQSHGWALTYTGDIYKYQK